MTAGLRESSLAATAWGHYREGRGKRIEMDQTERPMASQNGEPACIVTIAQRTAMTMVNIAITAGNLDCRRRPENTKRACEYRPPCLF